MRPREAEPSPWDRRLRVTSQAAAAAPPGLRLQLALGGRPRRSASCVGLRRSWGWAGQPYLARSNARGASTALAERRVEREEAEAFLAAARRWLPVASPALILLPGDLGSLPWNGGHAARPRPRRLCLAGDTALGVGSSPPAEFEAKRMVDKRLGQESRAACWSCPEGQCLRSRSTAGSASWKRGRKNHGVGSVLAAAGERIG